MKKNPLKLRIRRVAIWTVLVVAYCAFSVALIVWYASPSRQDLAFERQLVGKWGIWLAESDMNTPPERVIEWFSGGKSDDYSPGYERSLPQPDLWQNWYVRDGILISRLRSAEMRRTIETKFRLDWINSDRIRLTFDGIDGNPETIYYGRLDTGSDKIVKTDEPNDGPKSRVGR